MKHLIFIISLLSCTAIVFFGGYTVGKSRVKTVEKEVVKYIEVEKIVDNTEVTAEKVENYIAEIKEENAEVDCFPLSDEEYNEVCKVVMAEAGVECYDGQMAVAQCILNSCVKEGVKPSEVFTLYKYTPTRKTPSESVKTAVNAVFKNGEKVTEEEILYFYAPKYSNGTWHETQRFVLEIDGHKFFAQK